MPAVTIERSTDDAVVVMFWHDILAVWLKGPATIANQRDAERIASKLLEQWPRGIAMMVVIGVGLPLPSAEVKRELDAIYRRLAPNLRALSYVVLGSGFHPTMVRSHLIASNWVMRRPYATSTTGDVKKGATWLFYTLGEDAERGSVDQFTQALAAAVRGEAPTTLRTRS